MPRHYGPLLLVSPLLFALGASAQDYRNEPWNHPAQKAVTEIRLSSDGKLLTPLPEYISKTRPAKAQLRFVVTAPGNKPFGKPKTEDLLATALRRRLLDMQGALRDTASPLRKLLRLAACDDSAACALSRETDELLAGAPLTAKTGLLPEDMAGWLKDKSRTRSDYGLTLQGKVVDRFMPRPDTVHVCTMDLSQAADKKGRVSYGLQEYPVLDSLATTWKKTIAEKNRPAIQKWSQQKDELHLKYDVLRCKADISDCRARMKAWAGLDNEVRELRKKMACGLVDWQKKWLWYTGGVPVVNPFWGDPPEKPKGVAAKMDALRTRTDLVRGMLKECCGPQDDKRMALLTDSVVRMEAALRKLQGELDGYNERRASYEKAVRAGLVEKTENYDGRFYLSSDDSSRFMRNHDALQNYRNPAVDDREEYYSFEDRHILVHNATGNGSTVVGKGSSEKITHRSFLAEQADAIPFAPAIALEGLVESGFMERFASYAMEQGIADSLDLSFMKSINLKGKGACDSIKVLGPQYETDIRGQLDTIALLAQQFDTVLSVLDMRGKTLGPVRSTREIDLDIDPELPAKIDYKLTVPDPAKTGETKELSGGQFRLFKPVRVQLLGGVAYSIAPEPLRVELPANTNASAATQRKDRAQFFMAFKYYPYGGEIDDPRFLVFHKRRAHVTLGAGLPAPLDNFYAGVGSDLLPGLSWELMCQWYRYDRFSVTNGAVTERTSAYQPVLALGLGLDASVFTNLYTLLFK